MSQIGGKGRVIACDILDMNPIVGVDFLQGDFRDENVLNALLERVGEAKVDVVMSDMAPNFSGMPSVDIPRAMYLVELALDMCKQVLAKKAVLWSKYSKEKVLTSICAKFVHSLV